MVQVGIMSCTQAAWNTCVTRVGSRQLQLLLSVNQFLSTYDNCWRLELAS
jgi:hypothetical protein